MPYANNEGVRIYYEVEGKGEPLVMLHGFAGWLGHIRDTGYVEGLQDDYQLVLMDARGHGQSDKPHDREAYHLEKRVGDVVAVLDALSIPKAHFYGHSMGASVGWGIGMYAPERFHSLILAESFPVDPDPNSPPSPLIALIVDALKQGQPAFADIFQKSAGSLWQPQWREPALANDVDALMAHSTSPPPPAAVRLQAMTLPCLLILGEKDSERRGPAREYADANPHVRYVCLPGLGHIETCLRADLSLPHMRKFLAEVSQGRG